MNSIQAYIAVSPKGEYFFPSCSDENALAIEYVEHTIGETWKELKEKGWLVIDVELKPN